MKRIILSETNDAFVVDPKKIIPIEEGFGEIELPDDFIERRQTGEFAGKALYLPPKYDYVLGLDSLDFPVLVILEKEKGE